MKIYGAGLAGLLAGCIFQTALIFEAGPSDQVQHKAVLRFRSPAVGDAIGVDFRRVRVHKGIWSNGKFVEPNIQLANQYAMKVVGRLADRSIWNLDACDRWIAPEDFLAKMAERCGSRVEWNHRVTAEEFAANEDVAISTLPMSIVSRTMAQQAFPDLLPQFSATPIMVRRWRIPRADVHQTIYFPDPNTSLYRATITGDLLTAEFAHTTEYFSVDDMFMAFGISATEHIMFDTASQSLGKLVPIDDVWRKQFIFRLTTNHNVFSLGRFATWRNLLLDDVLQDIAVIKKLMTSSTYDRSRYAAKTPTKQA